VRDSLDGVETFRAVRKVFEELKAEYDRVDGKPASAEQG